MINSDSGRDTIYGIDFRPVHAVEELSGVGAESFNVASLSFCIKRVKDKRRFPGARETGDYREAADRNIEIEVLEVVLRGAANTDGRCGIGCCCGVGGTAGFWVCCGMIPSSVCASICSDKRSESASSLCERSWRGC